MNWSIITKGKHEGKSIPQIILNDPDYFYWAIENDFFSSTKLLLKQAEIVEQRASSVKIPDNDDMSLEIEHIYHPPDNTYARFDLEPVTKPVHHGGSRAHRAKYLDFRTPRRRKGYDKAGYQLFLKSFKENILGNSKIRITKKIAEDFFSNPSNFANP
ncbi:MAG: hypothetical protein WC716_06660 [Chitinophagaceae bacterium]|jgi:hypothetical protein